MHPFFFFFNMNFSIPVPVSSDERSAEVDSHASASYHVVQQPLCLQEEEEEIYISEPMQEITDGILVS